MSLDELRARLQSYIPHECEKCGGAGEVGNPEYAAWDAEFGAEFLALLKDQQYTNDPRSFNVQWAALHPNDPEPYPDVYKCGECNGSGITPRQDIRAEDLLAVLDRIDDGLRRAFNTIYSATGEGA